MATMEEKKTLILRHYETINYIPDIDNWKFHEVIWAWWEAMAYYQLLNHYTSLGDAPDGIESIHVTENGVINNYYWINGKYVYIQQWTKKFCKDVYGDKIPGTY